MNQLFYNIAGGTVHQIRREKWTTISEVIVRVKQNIERNRNWLYFKFLLKAQVLYLTILKRIKRKSSLTSFNFFFFFVFSIATFFCRDRT